MSQMEYRPQRVTVRSGHACRGRLQAMTLFASLLLAPLALASCSEQTASSPNATGGGRDFVQGVDNPYFPLEPGTVFTYKGKSPDGKVRETVSVTHRTKKILGAEATVVKDVTRLKGKLAEETFDWYAQDDGGNVWYLGEKTVEYENGKADPQGSWEAGKDGAQPGIIMPANPDVNDAAWQERYQGEAESTFWVISVDASLSVPAGDYKGAVRTLEWSPLDPRTVGEKFYARGVGLIAERALSGEPESVVLANR